MKNNLTRRFLSLVLAVLMIVPAMALAVSAADEHTHVGNGWLSDDKKHWQLCTADGAVFGDADHDHSGEWLEDAANHWRVCAVCGAFIDSNKHVDSNKDEYCDYCGISTHVHVATGKWISNEENHWKLCSCGQVAVSEKHIENARGYCSVCGVYVHTHKAKNESEWLKDVDNHWQVCACGEVINSAKHVDANPADQACDVCAASIHTHDKNFGDYLKDAKNHWKLCSCGVIVEETAGAHADNDANNACDFCGYNMAADVHVHAAQGEWLKDKDKHWLLCSCGEMKYYYADHTFKDGVCIACGYVSSSVSVGGSGVIGNWNITVCPDCCVPAGTQIVTDCYSATANEAKNAVKASYDGVSINSVVKFTIANSKISVASNSIVVGGQTLKSGEIFSVFGKQYVVDYTSAGAIYARFISLCDNKTIIYNKVTKTVETVFEDTIVRKSNTKAIVNGVEYDAVFAYGSSRYFLYKNGIPAGMVNASSASFYPGYDPASLVSKGNASDGALISFTCRGKNYVVYDIFSEMVSVKCANVPVTINVALNLGSFRPTSIIGGFSNSTKSYRNVAFGSGTAYLTGLKITRTTPVVMFGVVESPVYPVSVTNITPCDSYYDCWWNIVYPGISVKPGCTVHPGCTTYPNCTVKPGCTIHPGCYSYPSCIVPSTKSYAIVASCNVGGTLDPAGTAIIAHGKSMTYKFTPNEGFAIAKVLVDGVNVGKVSSFTFKNVSSKHTLQVVFEKVKMPFLDVYTADWYYKDIVYVWQNDIMQGTSYTKFNPAGDITRGMIVTMLWRLEGEPNSTGRQFSDVGSGSYYADAVRWAANKGIVLGYGDNTFRPNQNITREQLATILYRYIEYKGKGFVGNWDYDLRYSDVSDISAWALEAVSYLTLKNIIVTENTSVLNPDADASRAEAAVCLHRLCEFLD